MFTKVTKRTKDTRNQDDVDNMSFWCLFCYLETYFTPFSNVFIVDFEHVFVCWELISFIEQENVCYSYFQYSTKASAIISFAKILEIAVTSFLKKKKKKKIDLLFEVQSV